MANWCSTTYTITGNANEIECLKGHLVDATSKHKIENSWGNDWLGNLLTYCGVTETEIKDGKYRCRGSISYIGIDDDSQIVIDTETAWAPMHDPIRLMVERFAPNADVKWSAIEPGCGIYWRNYYDPEDEYLLDIWDDTADLPIVFKGMDYEFLSEDKLRSILAQVVGNGTIDELIKKTMDKYGDFLSINRFDCDERW